MQAMNITCTSLRICMEYALAHPAFLRRGGTLKLPCQHTYPHVENKAFVLTDDQPHLKGADACVVAMANSLDLRVCARMLPIVDPHRNVTSVCEQDATYVLIEYGEHCGISS